MKRNNTTRLVSVFTTTFFALGLLIVSVQAYYPWLLIPKSNLVAMVPTNACANYGELYVGSSWPLGDSFTFVNLSPTTIADGNVADPIVAGGFDTVVLMTPNFDFATLWADSDFSGRILSFVNGGGKLIIYASEMEDANAFANFIYPFTVDAPGETGSIGGTIVNLVDDTLSSNNPADESYIDLAKITSQTDAVGDANLMTSFDPNWNIDMSAINVYQIGGPVHTFASYGAGFIIYNGLDIDYAWQPPSNADGGSAIGMVWWRELAGVRVVPSGLAVTPPTATNPVDTTHTVTATVRTTDTNQPVAGVVVTFTIVSGPNAGLTGQDTTDANGEATFSWSSTVPGTDTVEASISNPAGGTITTAATKDWVPSPVIPEVPIGTILASLGCFAAFGTFYFTKRRRFLP